MKVREGDPDRPSRPQYIAAFARPHPWLWVAAPVAAILGLMVFRESMAGWLYTVALNCAVLALAWTLLSIALQLAGVRPAAKEE